MPAPQTPIEVFCAFAQADAPACLELEDSLKPAQRHKVLTLWHKGHLSGGTNRAHAIQSHLTTAPPSSDECESMAQQAIERHEAGEAHVIPILLRPTADWKEASFGRLSALPTDTQPITRWPDKDEAFADVVTGIRRAIEQQRTGPLHGSSQPYPPVWTVPYPRNPFFTGRQDLLTQLSTLLTRGQTTALSQPQAVSGLGGVGKTQLAVEYAYRHQTDYQAVLWARAESCEALTSSFLTLAEELHLPESRQHDATITVSAFKTWLQRQTGWLLILDNADDLNMVCDFLPPKLGGQLLLTTRAQAMGRLAHQLAVEPFTPELGAQFLLRRATILAQDASLSQATERDRTLALQITHTLGSLPLALDQAGAYLEETGCSLSAYHQLYQRHRLVACLRASGVQPARRR